MSETGINLSYYRRGEGGNCGGCGVNYELECQLCPPENRSKYIGETSRNLYTRSKEHVARHRAGKALYRMQQEVERG